MSKLNFDYVPLTFISDKQEIKKQIRNTLILIHLFEKYNNPVRLEKLIVGTQYGYNASALQSGNNKFLRISDIHDSKVNWDSVPYCNCDDEEIYLLKNEDILIARTGGTTGKSFKIDSPPKHSIYAGYLIRIRAKKEVNPDYIYLFLHSFAYWSQIVNLNERNFRPKANAENLKSLILPDCERNIQDEAVRISQGENLKGYEDLFSDIERALTEYDKTQQVENLLSDQLTQLENLNQAILQEAVQGKLVKQDKKDEPAWELLKRIKTEKAKSGKKEKPLPPIKPEEIPFEIPKNWVWCRLGEMCSKITDGFHNTPPKVTDGFPYIAATQVKSDKIDWDSCHYVSEKFHRELYVKTTPKKGEILVVNIGAGCGTPAIIDVDFEFSFKNTAILKFDQNEIHNKFIFYYFLLKRDEFYKDLTKGGLQPFLSLKILNDIVFPLPPLSEQKRIVSEIEKQLAKTKHLKEHIIANQQATEQLLKALLHQAFEVENKNDESVQQHGKVIEFRPRKCTLPEKTILAGRIIKLTNGEEFGRVKFQKLLYLTEHVCKLDLESNYVQKVAGPYDEKLLNEIETTLKRFQYYSIKRSDAENQMIRYTALGYSTELDSHFENSFVEEADRINSFLLKFKNSTWEQSEIVATLYAVWNNRIIKNEIVADDLLKQDFLLWDKQKAKYKNRLNGALEWMRTNNVIPDGYGKIIGKPM